jgi:peptide/nickel transport system permease protein
MFITRAWWLEVMPGLTIVGIALAATSLGQFVQKKLEGSPS